MFRCRFTLLRIGAGSCLGLLIALLFAAGTWAGGGQVQGDASKTTGPRYRFPEIMVIVYADFPNEPEQQLALAKYTASKGFNCVEAELDKLDVCRKAGLKVRLGSIDVNKLLQAAPKLQDDPAVFGYFVSDRRTSKAFPGFAKIARAFEAADPRHPTLFINRAEYNQFPEFVQVVKPMVLDYYHYHWWPKNHPEHIISICACSAT